MRNASLLTTAVVAALAFAAMLPARAEPQDRRAPDPLVAVADADPLELARAALRLGGSAVLERLSASDASAEVRLAAIRAAPFLVAKERALAPLAELARGRDPDLAPAAALALLRIARSLEADALRGRDVSAADLEPALGSLTALAEDEAARPDVRRAAELAHARLRSLLD